MILAPKIPGIEFGWFKKKKKSKKKGIILWNGKNIEILVHDKSLTTGEGTTYNLSVCWKRKSCLPSQPNKLQLGEAGVKGGTVSSE